MSIVKGPKFYKIIYTFLMVMQFKKKKIYIYIYILVKNTINFTIGLQIGMPLITKM